MALQISCKVVAAADGKELVQHGSTLFPIACYAEDLAVDSVSWHWHEDYEFVLATGAWCTWTSIRPAFA